MIKDFLLDINENVIIIGLIVIQYKYFNAILLLYIVLYSNKLIYFFYLARLTNHHLNCTIIHIKQAAILPLNSVLYSEQ